MSTKSTQFHCQLITLPLATDARGSLCFAENTQLPFPIERVFWIYGVPEGKTRGGHAHTTCADGKSEKTYHMDSPQTGILIPPNVWCELRNFSPQTICVVLASETYNSEGYINKYEDFKNL